MSARAVSPFSPRLFGAHLLMLVALAATIALGVWQYNVSHQHKVDQQTQLAHAAPRLLTDVMGGNDAFPASGVGVPVIVAGTWVPAETVFVSGRDHGDETGYWVATPVEVDGTKSAIYVVRGWTRSTSQVPAAPTGATRLVGWLQPSDQTDTTSDEAPTDDVLPALDMATLINHVHGDLFSAYVVGADHQAGWPASAAPVNDGSARLASVPEPALPKADTSTGLRNFLYAIEWWLFGIFAIYIWWRYVSDVTRPAPDEDDEGAPEESSQDRPVRSDV